MGLLDDAIREHLELKRRHGADPDEVTRLEHEAFGPVQRADALEAAPPAPAPAELASEPAPEFAPEPAPEFAPKPAPEPAPEFAPEPGLPPAGPLADLPSAGDEALEHELAREEEAAFEATLEDVPSASGSVPLEDLQETRAFTLDEVREAEQPVEPALPAEAEHVAPDPEPGEHDELEETPEFLQETPEHDRLWFEQKPPKDFDF